ncbi:hypothetical protein [Anaerosporobacter faecicola]|uniref:hypothetical protein n=1 Tax=Anaerosporobacter faecicola TaxID=2718714 RepID=UPI0014387678|nr:hypothetical protein [Anaerosporobacter faecicola]
MKKYINRKTILLSTTLAVLVLTLITVTVAWFESSVFVQSDESTMNTASWDFKVSLTAGGEPVKNTDKINLNVGTFTNVATGKLAPGTSGHFSLFITSNSDVTTGYQIGIDKSLLTLIIPAGEGHDTDMDYSDLLKKHFQFYTTNELGEKTYITEAVLAEGNLEIGVEKEVVLYWEWPYEADVSELGTQEEKDAAIKQYDEEDTFIGENKQYIAGGITVNVKGVQAEPITP